MITDITNSRFEFVFYLLLVFIIYLIYAAVKRIRMKSLIADARFKNAKTFRFGIETTMAISDDGLIGIVNVSLETITINIKDIEGFEVHISRYIIPNAGAAECGGLLFAGVGNRLKQILEQEKTKGVVFFVRLKNDGILNISLFKGTRLKTKPTGANQNIIVQLFKTLEEVEKKCAPPRAR